MTIQYLRALAQMASLKSYYERSAANRTSLALRQSITAKVSSRDASRGEELLTTPDGGSLSARSIGGSIAPGAVAPSVSIGSAGSYVDSAG